MQVTGNSAGSSSIYGMTARPKAPADTSASFVEAPLTPPSDDSSLSSNALFQNLMKFESVQKYVTLSDDGTYSFNWTPGDGPLTSQQFTAKGLIAAAEAGNARLSQGSTTYAQSDLDLFKKATGYNFVVLDGGEMVVDDNGNPVAAADLPKVKAAWDYINTIGFARERGELSGDVTLENFGSTLQRFATSSSDDKVVREMLAEFMKAMGASAEDIAALKSASAPGANGISTWTWNRVSSPSMADSPTNAAQQSAADLAEALKYLSSFSS